MSLTLLALIILVGIILLVLEIILLPGLIAGITGLILIVLPLGWIYVDYGSTIGNISFAVTLALTVTAVYFSFKSKAWNRFGLKSSIDSNVNDISEMNVQVGDHGTCVSALRPSGTVEINGQRMEAASAGNIIDAGSKIVVVEVFATKVIVKPA
ncbi:MAG: NfeD family protein [Bacteroidota bacterium]